LNTTGVTYTLIVSNNSCNNAINGVTVTDTNIVSTKFTGLTYTPTTGTTAQSGTNRVWTVGNLAAGTSATLTITGTPNTLGILATAATATATTTGLASTSVLSATASINTRDFNYVGFILPTDTVTEGTDLSYAAEIDSNLLASSPITINYTVTGTGAGASDITVTSAGSVTINPSSVDFPQNTSINFNIIDDSVYEITKAITLTITSVTSNDASVKLDPATSSITITLLDNDMPTLVAEYQFDEASWTGATAEVQDTSGHGFNGKAKGVSGLPITQNTTPAIATDPGTCTYGKFGGASTGQHVNFGATNLGLGGAVGLSVTAWVRWGVDPATGNQWSNVISNGNSGSGQFWIQHSQLNNHFEFAVKTSVTRNYVWSKTTPVMGQWYHVAGVYDGAALHMYVNGVLDDYSTVALTGTVTPYVSTYFFNIGIDNSYVRSFQGDIDEVKIFSGGLSDSQVADLYAEVHPCPVIPAPHHIEVSHASGTGATCAPSALTLRACSDAACTALYTAGVTGTMSATGTPTVNWDGSTGGATGAGFVIAAGSSSVTKNVQVTTVGTTVIGTTLVTPTPLGTSPVCTFGTPTCTFTATSAGAFTVSVPSHRSCTLQAPTITLPAACASTLTGSKSVGLKFAYVSPSTPATPTAHVPYAGLASPGSALATAANVAVNLTFAGGVASLPYFVYDDAGSLTLSASYTGSGVDAGLSITGTSPAFVVAPNSFTLSGVDASLVAGKPFNTTVTAMNACTTPAATPNFTGTVVLSSGNPLPAQGNATAISQSLASFSAGVASTSLTWGEVGSIDLTASLSNYLLSGISVTGSKTAVGSFKPAYFDTTVIKACNTFTYSGQPFTTKVTARALGGTTTANYAGATYARAVALSASGSLAGAFTNAAITAASFAAGEATASPTFTFSTNPSGRATLAVHAVDTDGVTSTVAAVGPPAVAGTEGSTDLLSGRIRLQNAFGSEKLALTLPIQAQYYDSTSAAFKLNTEDSCTALTWPAVQTLAGTASPGPAAGVYFYPVVTNKNQITSTDTTRTPSGSVPIAAGKANLQFSAPQKRGWVDVIMTVPDYLLGNWGNCLNQGSDTLLNDMPCARATFGVFGAKSPIIYRRENY
jgi:MSHA biogenesis protein MshQ